MSSKLSDGATVYAGLWARTVAFALDYLVISAYLIALTVLFLSVGPPVWLFRTHSSAHLAGFVMLTLPVSLYFVLLENSAKQGTWGKQRRGLRVTTLNGARISLGRSVLRTALKFLPWELSHTAIWRFRFSPHGRIWLTNGLLILAWALAGIYVALLATTHKRQSLYDLLAGTTVIHCNTA
jgi:uncharacterized RDD family membrane protein YckC